MNESLDVDIPSCSSAVQLSDFPKVDYKALYLKKEEENKSLRNELQRLQEELSMLTLPIAILFRKFQEDLLALGCNTYHLVVCVLHLLIS